eukprot:7351331-Alexandrium_andersonii.AAC.1
MARWPRMHTPPHVDRRVTRHPAKSVSMYVRRVAPHPATENGTRTWGGQPGSESIGQALPNPWWWGPPLAGSTP